MANPLHRHDQPTDYQALWNRLRQKLGEMQRDYAALAMTTESESEMRKMQGAYGAMSAVESEMDGLLSLAREEKRSA